MTVLNSASHSKNVSIAHNASSSIVAASTAGGNATTASVPAAAGDGAHVTVAADHPHDTSALPAAATTASQDTKSVAFQQLLAEHTKLIDQRQIRKHYAVYGPAVEQKQSLAATPADMIDALVRQQQRAQQRYEWLSAGTIIVPSTSNLPTPGTTPTLLLGSPLLNSPLSNVISPTYAYETRIGGSQAVSTSSSPLNRAQSVIAGNHATSGGMASLLFGPQFTGVPISALATQMQRITRQYEEMRQLKSIEEQQESLNMAKKKLDLCSEKAPFVDVEDPNVAAVLVAHVQQQTVAAAAANEAANSSILRANFQGGPFAPTVAVTATEIAKNITNFLNTINTLFCLKLETLYEFLENFILPDVGARWDASGKFGNEIVRMVTCNVYRRLPDITPSTRPRLCRLHSRGDQVDLRDFALEEAWPLLRVVYAAFYAYLNRQDFQPDKCVVINNNDFVARLLWLMMRSEDARERDMLLLIVHKIYQLYPGTRPHVRLVTGTLLLQFLYCDNGLALTRLATGPNGCTVYDGVDNCYGIGEALQLYTCIVKGLRQRPIAREYARVLFRIIMPLHKLSCTHLWQEHLAECVKQFLLKEPSISKKIFKMLLLYWPKTNSFKEMLFIDEIELLLQCLNRRVFNAVAVIVFQRLIACAQSVHFQVALRALRVWQNPRLHPLLQNASKLFLPVIFPSLHKISQQPHWHPQVGKQAYEVLKLTLDLNPQLFSDLSVKFRLDCMEQKAIEQVKEHDKERVKIDALKELLRQAKENEAKKSQMWMDNDVHRLEETVAVAEACVLGADEDEVLADLEEKQASYAEQSGEQGDDDDDDERWSARHMMRDVEEPDDVCNNDAVFDTIPNNEEQ